MTEERYGSTQVMWIAWGLIMVDALAKFVGVLVVYLLGVRLTDWLGYVTTGVALLAIRRCKTTSQPGF